LGKWKFFCDLTHGFSFFLAIPSLTDSPMYNHDGARCNFQSVGDWYMDYGPII